MYQLDKLKNIPELVHGFSDVKDGNMSFVWGERKEVLNNRKAFLEKLDIKSEDSVSMFLKHGTEIMSVNEFSRGEDAMPVDCLMTKSKNVFLFVLTADCLPLVLYDADKSILALAHISRINAPRNFIQKIIGKMESEYGVRPDNSTAAIGPCIHKESYVFGDEEFKKRVPNEEIFEGFIGELKNGRKSIDLVGYNVAKLVSAGVDEKNIEISGIDTAKDKKFFSHYRSRRDGELEGRMATVVGILG